MSTIFIAVLLLVLLFLTLIYRFRHRHNHVKFLSLEELRDDARSLVKIPSSVGYIINSLTVEKKADSYIDSIASLVEYSSAYSIRNIVVYDAKGYFNKLFAEICTQVKTRMEKDKEFGRYTVVIHSRQGVEQLQPLAVLDSPTKQEVCTVSVFLTSLHDSYMQLTDNFRTYVRSHVTSGNDETLVPNLQQENPFDQHTYSFLLPMHENMKHFPDEIQLVVVFDKAFVLHGFFPYHISNAEIYQFPELSSLKSSDFSHFMHKYSACEQRRGK